MQNGKPNRIMHTPFDETAHFDETASRIAPHYRHFDVENRLLLSGHSHQAWPDVALEGQKEAFFNAARHVDDKWSYAFEKVEHLRGYLREFYDDPDGRYCLSESTHNLLVRWLSALDLPSRPRLVTTDAEFHSIHRQLIRLEQEGVEVVRVPAEPLEGFAGRLDQALTRNTAAVLLSRIYYDTALRNIELDDAAGVCRHYEVPLLIDDYHGTNVMPLPIRGSGLQDCYLLVGGYKYMQWGEGNCFLRFPGDCALQPVITGWFAAFGSLSKPRNEAALEYEGDQRFGGATYDTTAQFRAARVVDFFREMALTPQRLMQLYHQQVSHLRERFEAMNTDPEVIRLRHTYPLSCNGGFLALESPHAGTLHARLKKAGVYCDYRENILRLGPAPYVTSAQIDEAMDILEQAVRTVDAG